MSESPIVGFLPGPNGLLIPFDSIEDMADAVRVRLADDPSNHVIAMLFDDENDQRLRRLLGGAARRLDE